MNFTSLEGPAAKNLGAWHLSDTFRGPCKAHASMDLKCFASKLSGYNVLAHQLWLYSHVQWCFLEQLFRTPKHSATQTICSDKPDKLKRFSLINSNMHKKPVHMQNKTVCVSIRHQEWQIIHLQLMLMVRNGQRLYLVIDGFQALRHTYRQYNPTS